MSKFNVASFLNDNAVLERLEAAKLDESGKWEMPWIKINGNPRNFTSGREYNGCNIIFSHLQCMSRGFNQPLFAGLGQIKKAGLRVKHSEFKRPCYMVLYKPIPKERENKETGEKEKYVIKMLRYLTVYNIQQLENWEEVLEDITPTLEETPRVEHLDEWFSTVATSISLKGGIKEQGDVACYIPSSDEIHMPTIDQFRDANYFYSTLAHELTHSTGHDSRCNRKIKNRFASEAYAFEELVAELGSMMLSSILGINATPREDHFKYLANWIKGIKDEPSMFFEAAALAGKAVDYLLEKNGGQVVHEWNQEEAA